MPVWYDTHLGWKADGLSIVLTGGLFGGIQKAETPIDLPFFNQQPSFQQVQQAGASFYYNNKQYWFAFWNSNSHSPDLKVCIVQNSQNNGAIYVVSTYRNASTGRNFNIKVTDGIHEWSRTGMSESTTGSLDSASGLYYASTTVFSQISSSEFPWQTPGYTSGTVIVDGPNISDTLAHFITTVTRFYKLNDGAAASGFVKWYNTEGDVRVSPFQISSDPNFVQFSYNNLAPAPDEVDIGMTWQGMHFTMSLFASYQGQVIENVTPIYDLTAAYDYGIGAGVVFEALLRATFVTVLNAPDPYHDESEEGGGNGSPDDEDDVDFTTPPSGGSVGFYRIWNPSAQDLQDLADWLWSNNFDLTMLKKLFANPMDTILGLAIVPVLPQRIGGYNIHIGGIDTGIQSFTVTDRYATVNCGSLTVEERWGAYLDYSPYTKMSIFLPYIGFRDIDADDVMNKTVELQYNIDVLSGACCAELKCGGTVLYSWQGQCAQQLPVTSTDWSSAFSTVAGLAGAAVSMVASAGTSAPLLAGSLASASVNALSLKPRFNRSGSIGGAGGFLASQTPYLVRSRPEQAIPGEQNKFIGYPSFVTRTMGEIAGYTELDSFHLEGIPATSGELAEIESLLRGGVIL